MKRQSFLLTSSAAMLAGCGARDASPVPSTALGPALRAPANRTLVKRLEVEEFSTNRAMVDALRKTVKLMRAVADPADTRSWAYWHNSHWMPSGAPPKSMELLWNQCRHAQSYFLAWHRGFLAYFERIAQTVSGDPTFALPYWDYYQNPNVPKIFAEPTLSNGEANPLYWENRKNATVAGLSYASFQPGITAFPWGPGESFEDLLERNPHNRVHSQIGGSMGQVPLAPADPVFYVHHCNIDRYWSAWLAAGGNRRMPPSDDLWWGFSFYYNQDRSWSASVRDLVSTTKFGYDYSSVALPVPPPAALMPARPPVVLTVGRGGAPLALRLEPVTLAFEMPDLSHASTIVVELEGVRATELGARGGYSFSIYANLPETPQPLSASGRYEIGELGSFELSMPSMPGMTVNARGRALAFDVTASLRVTGARTMLLSFVPFGTPARTVRDAELIQIGRVRLTAG